MKTQLNVMARRQVHETLEKLATAYGLRGKGEAVSFACFVTQGLVQRAEYSEEAARILSDFVNGYHRDREIHAP